MNRKIVGALAAALALCTGMTGAARAQGTWPDRPIRMIVPFPPGGGTDALARVVATHLQTVLGQPVAVENRGGGSGVVGTEAVARAAPDGYTLAMTASGPMTILPQMMPNPPYDPVRSFSHVALPSVTPLFAVVPAASPVRSLSELIALARRRDGQLNYCSIGVASPSHLSAEIFLQSFSLRMEHIPHRGSAPALTDTIAGHCDLLFDSGTSSTPQIRQGALRALGVSAARRLSGFPDVPTIAEQGAPGYETSTWSAVIAPAGTPAPIVERLNTEIRRFAATPAERERVNSQGGLPVDFSPAEFTRFLEREIESWGQVVRARNIQLQ